MLGQIKSRSLLAQVLAVNLLLVAGTVLVATIAVDAHLERLFRGREALIFGLAILATLLGNWVLLRRRFEPLDRMISSMEQVDLAAPAHDVGPARAGSAEVQRLNAAFRRMIARLETERREAGRAAIRAQERERRRIAQDLHDEVNQALTAVSLRLQASIEQAPPELQHELTETKRLSSQAMEELLTLARQLRPGVLDDHGLLPALHSQVRDFGDQTRIQATFSPRGTVPRLPPRAAAGDLPGDPGEPLQHRPARPGAQRRREAVVRGAHSAADQRRRLRLRHRPCRGPRAQRDARACAARGWTVVDLVGSR
jgi:two-component system sensor histidine kinase UhpB